MAENENIEKEKLPDPGLPDASDQTSNADASGQHPDIDGRNLKPQISNLEPMDVHHHSHGTHKKKWTEYLLEFFMLFLAVFLGFVAENIREHLVERNREKDYIKLLIQDLQTDSTILRSQIPAMKQSIRGLDTLIAQTYLYIKGKGDTRQMYFTYHHYCRNVFDLQLSERTINQLKNSGNMRLIHNSEAANIISGAEVGFEHLREQTRFYKIRQEDPANFGLKIFDFGEYLKANTGPDGTLNTDDLGFRTLNYQPALNVTDPVYLKEFAASVGYYRNTFDVYVSVLENVIPQLESAINSLKKNYHIDH